jgi:protease I
MIADRTGIRAAWPILRFSVDAVDRWESVVTTSTVTSTRAKPTKVAFLVAAEGIEQAELTAPWQAVIDAGCQPVLVSQEMGEVQAYRHLDRADRFAVDVRTADAGAEEFAALVLPGGVANGDTLRTQDDAVRLVRAFDGIGKPIAAICHGGWVLIEAGVVRGRRLTSWPSLRTDYRNAGATWVDEEVVLDAGTPTLISSRKPDDLPAFCREIVHAIAAGATSAHASVGGV